MFQDSDVTGRVQVCHHSSLSLPPYPVRFIRYYGPEPLRACNIRRPSGLRLQHRQPYTRVVHTSVNAAWGIEVEVLEGP